MAAITIRDIDDDVKERLRVRAAENGRSMEAEARAILERATSRPKRPKNVAVALMDLADRFDGVELDLSRPVDFEVPRDPFADWSEEDFRALETGS